MIARRYDAELQAYPRPRRHLWLWGVVAGLAIATGLATMQTCKDDPAADRPKVSPVVPAR